jgi:hypothetical protein
MRTGRHIAAPAKCSGIMASVRSCTAHPGRHYQPVGTVARRVRARWSRSLRRQTARRGPRDPGRPPSPPRRSSSPSPGGQEQLALAPAPRKRGDSKEE